MAARAILTLLLAATALFTPRLLARAVDRGELEGLPQWLTDFLAGTATAHDSALRFEELVHDFGTLLEGDLLEREFAVLNTGARPVTLLRHRACGCVTASYPRTPLAPGERAVVHATLDSRGRTGPQVKEVVLFTDEDEDARTSFVLKGTVESPLIPRPAQIHVPDAKAGETSEHRVAISVQTQGVSNVRVTAPADFLEARLEARDGGFDLTVHVQAPEGESSLQGSVLLECDLPPGHPRTRWQKEIPVRVVVPPAFSLLPQRVTLRGGTGSLTVRAADPAAARVTGVESTTPLLTVTEKRRAGNLLVLEVTLAAGARLPAGSKVRILTTSPTMPVLEADVVAEG